MIILAQEAPAAPSRLQLIVELIQALAWPALVATGFIVFKRQIVDFITTIQKRVDEGATLKILQVEFGAAPTNLPNALSGEVISADFMALIHSSWRYPKKDAEFGRRMWVIHVVIQARDEVLDRIESAKYILHSSYPNPIQVKTDRTTRFELKELANGESTVRCEVRIKGQPAPVLLERYINLTETGPRL